ncbi:MAG: carboxypeptidase-like regulatory domain-containing protein [Allomuricauda sp.]
MKRIVVIVFLLTLKLSAQKVVGHVFDAKTKEPIVGASVYYDASSIGTITDENGDFEIELAYQNNATLVIRYLGYVTKKMISLPKEAVLNIGLEEDIENLAEVVLTSDPFTRKDKMEVFRLEFLGDTRAGRASKILNEDDIHLYFNSQENTLSAFCDKPVIIQNGYLGYTIHFTIDEFKIFFRKKSLERIDNVYYTLFDGTTRFYDDSKGDLKIESRRRRAYLGSPRHFMQSCWRGDLQSQNFRLKKKYKDIEIGDFIKNENNHLGDLKSIRFLGDQFVIYHKIKSNYRSTLKINKVYTTHLLDRYGNYSPFENLVFGGHMSSYRIGNMLPMNYGF